MDIIFIGLGLFLAACTVFCIYEISQATDISDEEENDKIENYE